MALLIDTPRWHWRGRLWAHLISDESVDELHDAARALGLRWLSFGRDHYDVPDLLWPQACDVAELVDSRDIVRTLRRTGLRVPGGKPQKAWRWIEALPPDLRDPAIDAWLAGVRSRLERPAIDVLTRPGEHVVLHLLDRPTAPSLDQFELAPAPHTRVIETIAEGRWSVELVIEHA